jgi:ribose 5-phosphate isomerase A
MAVRKAGPIVTDNGNFVIDAPFDEATMKDPLAVSNFLLSCLVPYP